MERFSILSQILRAIVDSKAFKREIAITLFTLLKTSNSCNLLRIPIPPILTLSRNSAALITDLNSIEVTNFSIKRSTSSHCLQDLSNHLN